MTKTFKAQRAAVTEAVRKVGQRVRRWSAGAATATALTLAVEVVPASRPKVSRWGTYYGKTYNKFRAAAPDALMKEIRETEAKLFDKDVPLLLLLEIIKPVPVSGGTKLWPRGDADNFAKSLLDCANKRLWDDDDQVVSLTCTKRYAAEGEAEGAEYHLVPILEANL